MTDPAEPAAQKLIREMHERLGAFLNPPDPYAHLRAANLEGKMIQCDDNGIWLDLFDADYLIGEHFIFKRPPERYRIKPWTLPELPPGQAWHRTDWSESMLPEGWRPLLKGELNEDGDEGFNHKGSMPGELDWAKLVLEQIPANCTHTHLRTRRPLPPATPEPRVVPPAVVPWTRETCPPLPFEVRNKAYGNRYAVVAALIEGVSVGTSQDTGTFEWGNLLQYYTMADGSPCGELDEGTQH